MTSDTDREKMLNESPSRTPVTALMGESCGRTNSAYCPRRAGVHVRHLAAQRGADLLPAPLLDTRDAHRVLLDTLPAGVDQEDDVLGRRLVEVLTPVDRHAPRLEGMRVLVDVLGYEVVATLAMHAVPAQQDEQGVARAGAPEEADHPGVHVVRRNLLAAFAPGQDLHVVETTVLERRSESGEVGRNEGEGRDTAHLVGAGPDEEGSVTYHQAPVTA
ncbi:hypothetical protein OG427_39250 [Streptomyces sp. NBC_00133]